jgi:hypothetical protein
VVKEIDQEREQPDRSPGLSLAKAVPLQGETIVPTGQERRPRCPGPQHSPGQPGSALTLDLGRTMWYMHSCCPTPISLNCPVPIPQTRDQILGWDTANPGLQ